MAFFSDQKFSFSMLFSDRRHKSTLTKSGNLCFDPFTIISQDMSFFKRCQAYMETTSRIEKTAVC